MRGKPLFFLVVPVLILYSLGTAGLTQEAKRVPEPLLKQYPAFTGDHVSTLKATYEISVKSTKFYKDSELPLSGTLVHIYWKKPDLLRVRYEEGTSTTGAPGAAVQSSDHSGLKQFLQDRIRFLSFFVVQEPFETTPNRYVHVQTNTSKRTVIDVMRNRQRTRYQFDPEHRLRRVERSFRTFGAGAVQMEMDVRLKKQSSGYYVRKLEGKSQYEIPDEDASKPGKIEQNIAMKYRSIGRKGNPYRVPEQVTMKFSGREGSRSYRLIQTLKLVDIAVNQSISDSLFH